MKLSATVIMMENGKSSCSVWLTKKDLGFSTTTLPIPSRCDLVRWDFMSVAMQWCSQKRIGHGMGFVLQLLRCSIRARGFAVPLVQPHQEHFATTLPARERFASH